MVCSKGAFAIESASGSTALCFQQIAVRAIALTAKAVRLRHFREGSLPPGLMLARRASDELVENVPPIAPKGGIRNNLV
jgi:hypothetical protein